jgi:hypothetical protein
VSQNAALAASMSFWAGSTWLMVSILSLNRRLAAVGFAY